MVFLLTLQGCVKGRLSLMGKKEKPTKNENKLPRLNEFVLQPY